MSTASTLPGFDFEIRVPANGKLGKSTIVVSDSNGKIIYTDKADLTSATERRKAASRIGANLQLDLGGVSERLEERWNDAADQYRVALETEAAVATAQAAAANSAAPVPDPLRNTPSDVIRDAEDYLRDPKLLTRVADDLQVLGVAGERELGRTLYLVGVSRLLPKPLSAILNGSSSSGKSYNIEKVAELMPPEHVIVATQMTPQALFHMPRGSLRHKLIVGGERSRIEDDDRAEAKRALREMISSGRLSKMMPVKVTGGNIETQLIEQEGPIAFLESTTLGKVFEEDSNRCLLLQTDETKLQTNQIIALTADRAQNPVRPAMARLVQVHRTVQRLLQIYPVAIPFAKLLGELFPTDRVEARRAFSHLLTLIASSTLLHQRQRTLDCAGWLQAAPADYDVARRLLLRPLARLIGDAVSDAAQRFHPLLVAAFPLPTCFTTSEAKQVSKAAGKTSVRNWLHELREAGVVETAEQGRGQKSTTWRLVSATLENAAIALPTMSQLFGP